MKIYFSIILLFALGWSVPAQNKKDLLLLRTPVSSTSAVVAGSELRIYPTQIADEFFVSFDGKSLRLIIIKSLDGKTIDTLSLELHDEGIYRGSVKQLQLPGGMYIMELPAIGKSVMVMFRH